jgi:hypothetical protein
MGEAGMVAETLWFDKLARGAEFPALSPWWADRRVAHARR